MPELPPVLVVAFNRPDITRRVLDAVQAAGVKRLFYAVDGPRPVRAGEEVAVAAVQELGLALRNQLAFTPLFQSTNLGCKVAVSRAITWFFDQVEEGIVLEDDCLPHPTFFPFAAELLDRFRHDRRIFMVSGDNFQFGRRRTADSYYFSRYPHTWGWATWRRAWREYDHGMKRWPKLRQTDWLLDILGDVAAARYWRRLFDETYEERNAAWDYRWTYSMWLNGGLAILPNVNLVSNIGYGSAGTHTWWRWSKFAEMGTSAMVFPLAHPPFTIRDDKADRYTQRTVFKSRWWRKVARALYSRMRAMRAARTS